MFTTGDIFFLVVFITSPLILLLASRLVTRFPPLMAVLLFFLGPLAGTSMLVAVGEFAKAKPVLSRIPAALPFFYFFYGLPIFGLWVVVVGVVGWCGLRRVASVRQMGAGRKICGSAALGLLI